MDKNLRNKKNSVVLAALIVIFSICVAPIIHEKGEELGSSIRTHFLERCD